MVRNTAGDNSSLCKEWENCDLDPTSVAPDYDEEAIENEFEIEHGAEDQIQPRTKSICNAKSSTVGC